jgi:hypothetical protein
MTGKSIAKSTSVNIKILLASKFATLWKSKAVKLLRGAEKDFVMIIEHSSVLNHIAILWPKRMKDTFLIRKKLASMKFLKICAASAWTSISLNKFLCTRIARFWILHVPQLLIDWHLLLNEMRIIVNTWEI